MISLLIPSTLAFMSPPIAVVPILLGPMQALLAALPAILMALGTLIVSLAKPSTMKKLLKLLWVQKIPVALVALAVWGLVYLQSILFTNTADTARKNSAKSDWPLFRGSLDRRGYMPGAEDPVNGNILWSFSHDGVKTFFSSPAVIGNRMYVTSACFEFFKDKGAICSVDADTGKLVWAFQKGYRSTFSSPSISGKYLVVGEGLHLTKNAGVFCIDLEQSEQKHEGVKLWSFKTKSQVESSPCIGDGKVYFGAGYDGLYCIPLKPEMDKDGNPKPLWHLEGDKYPDCETSPVYYNGKVYFGLGRRGGQSVCCADANTGELLWRVKTPYPVASSPAILENKLFVGMGCGDFINTAQALAVIKKAELIKKGASPTEIAEALKDLKPAGEVWCIDLATHEKVWNFPVGDTVLGTISAGEGRIYFGSRDKNIYCISTGGKLIQKREIHEPVTTSLSVAKSHVYVVTETGKVLGFNKKDLSPAWELPLNFPSISSPVVANGHLYVGTTGNGVVCAGQPGGLEEKPVWAGFLGGGGKSGWLDGSSLTPRASYAWSYPVVEESSRETAVPVEIHAPAAYLNGAFFIGYNQGSEHGLAKLDAKDNTGSVPPLAWFAKAKNKVYRSAAVNEGAAFFVDGKPGDQNRLLRAIDIKDGKELWTSPVENDASGEFIISREKLLIAATVSGVTCLDVKNPRILKQLWKADVGTVTGAPVLAGDIALVIAGATPELMALDLGTGMNLWKNAVSAKPTSGPLFLKGMIWTGDAQGVNSYSLLDGKPVFTINCGPVASPLVCNSDRIACVNPAGEIVIVDAENGKEIDRIQKVSEAVAFPPVLLDNEVLYGAEGSIQRYDLGTKKSEQWAKMESSWLGKMSTPMILVNSSVFFATDKEGFVCMKPKTK